MIDEVGVKEQLSYLNSKAPQRGKILQFINMNCKVCPLPRPRWSGKHIYQPKDNQRSLLFETMHEKSLTKPVPIKITCPVIVDHFIQFERKNKKDEFATKLHLGDYDNLSKAINDSLVVAGFLEDDKIIVRGETVKYYDLDEYSIDYCSVVIYKAILPEETE